jgi:hypothetical protein
MTGCVVFEVYTLYAMVLRGFRGWWVVTDGAMFGIV